MYRPTRPTRPTKTDKNTPKIRSVDPYPLTNLSRIGYDGYAGGDALPSTSDMRTMVHFALYA